MCNGVVLKTKTKLLQKVKSLIEEVIANYWAGRSNSVQECIIFLLYKQLLNNIVELDSDVTMPNNIVDNYEQCELYYVIQSCFNF